MKDNDYFVELIEVENDNTIFGHEDRNVYEISDEDFRLISDIAQYTDVSLSERKQKAEQVLIDNGIDKDEAYIVLQAIGYTLLNTELYKD